MTRTRDWVICYQGIKVLTQIVSILLDCKEHKIVDSHNVPLPKTKVLSHVYHLYIPFCIIHFYHLSHTSHVSNQSYVRHLISQMCPIALITSVNPSLVGGGGGRKVFTPSLTSSRAVNNDFYDSKPECQFFKCIILNF